jgi:NADPH:quinone reductase
VRKPKEKIEQEAKVLGWDAAGVVVDVGPECTLFKKGDEVFYAGSIARPGTNAEFHAVDERIVGLKPKSLTYTEAAALPLTGLTALEGLFERLGISRNASDNNGKSVLIIGAAGGVGSIATQLAKLAGLTVIGTASRPESETWVKQHGADHVINHHESFRPQLESIGLKYVDYIFCLNSTAKHWEAMADVIMPQGKICSIVETPELLNLELLFHKSATFVWELMFTRSLFQTDDMMEQHKLLNHLADLVDTGKIKTTLTEKISSLNAENLRKAHALLESGTTIGKIVIEI